MRNLVRLCVLRVKYELEDSRAIAQVDEDDAAVVAATVNPARDAYRAALVLGPQLAAPGVAVSVRAQRLHASSRMRRSTACTTAAVSIVSCCPLAHVLQRGLRAVDDRDVARTRSIGLRELASQRAACELHLRGKACRTGLAKHLECLPPLRGVAECDEEVELGLRSRVRLLARREQHALDSRRPADAGRRRPAEHLHEAVIATTAADSALRSERIGGQLEDGSRVVVEPTHERRVELIGDLRDVEQLAHGGEVLGVLCAEVIEEPRRTLHHALRALVLGVKGAQGVGVDALTDLRR